MAGRRNDGRRPPSMWEMVSHPFATLNKIQGLDRLPDRRVSKRRAPNAGMSSDDPDPLRRDSRVRSIYKALGIYALEESRVELYESFREMDTDPVVAAVLDAFGADAAQRDSEHKRVVWVESASEAVSKIVTQTLDRNRIDQWAFPVCRALGRDGDVLMHIAAARGHGVVALRPYEPWTVARIEDEVGRLIGFAPSDEQGKACQTDRSSVPHYRVLHFRLPPRELTDCYGAGSSFLWGSRITWRQIQLMLDQVVIQRLLRRPDRLAILMDTTGMSHDDAWLTIKDWERRLYREWSANPAQGQFSSMGTPLDIAKDVVLPKGANNNTTIQGFPATNTNDLMKDLDWLFRQFAAGIQFPLGFIGLGDLSGYQAGQSLSRQSQPFAKRTERLQQCFLSEIARLCMIDLAFKGLDPYNPHNAFTLAMSTISPIQEIERNEIIQLKTDRLERALALGNNAGFDMAVWIPLILERYGGFSKEVIKRIYKGAPPRADVPPPNQSPTGPITYTERELRQIDEEVGDLMPKVDAAVRCVSSTLIPTLTEDKDKAPEWRPSGLDESTGKGKALEEALMQKPEPFTKTDEGQMLKVNEHVIATRAARAQTRVELITSLAELVAAGGM